MGPHKPRLLVLLLLALLPVLKCLAAAFCDLGNIPEKLGTRGAGSIIGDVELFGLFDEA